jgi:nucleotide-binding universal stress UspA family protein
MFSMSRILVPVDFSNRCLGMMSYVKAIAQRYNSEVILLHVVNPVYAIPDPGGSAPALIPVPQRIFEERAEQLEKFAVAELQGIPVRRLAYEGNAESQIASVAESESIGLVAMPTHGYGLLRRWLIGSVTSKVLHDVSCPVLTGVHTEVQPPLTRLEFSNIVCAIDFNEHSASTLAWASKFANDFGAKLSLVHVIPGVSSGFHLIYTSDVKREMKDVARKAIEELQKNAGIEGAANSIQEGDVASGVCSFSESTGADLVIIGRGLPDGTAGRLRTNAYAIIRQSPCPVISV